MSFSYKPLWKLLIDKEMTKKALMQATGISKSTMDKMGRGEQVSMDIIDRLLRSRFAPQGRGRQYRRYQSQSPILRSCR